MLKYLAIHLAELPVDIVLYMLSGYQKSGTIHRYNEQLSNTLNRHQETAI